MKYTYWFLIIVTIFLLYVVFHFIHSLSSSGIIYLGGMKESFINDAETSTVNMPINTTYNCQNFCGPTSRCAMTGQQCFSDMDCPGCQLKKDISKAPAMNIPGDDSAGKLTFGPTPQYSSLTSGYGTRQLALNHANQPDQANFGVNTWKDAYNESKELFDRRYKPTNLEFMPEYKDMYTLTGEFSTDSPLPSNY